MGAAAGEGVLGMLIDESLPVAGAQAQALPVTGSALTRAPVFRRVANLMNTTLSAHDKLVSENFEQLVVRLPAQGFGTTEFEMSDERRGLLVEAGCATMRAYFENQDLAGPVSFGLGDAEGERPITRQADRVALRMLGH